MKVLIVVSLLAPINEMKKAKKVIKDLMKHKYSLLVPNLGKGNYELKVLLEQNNYFDYEVIGGEYSSFQYSEIINKILTFNIDIVIVIGLVFNDPILPLLDILINGNSELFIVPQEYGVYSDASKLINQGANFLGTIYDLNRY